VGFNKNINKLDRTKPIYVTPFYVEAAVGAIVANSKNRDCKDYNIKTLL